MNIWWPHERLIINMTGGALSLDEARVDEDLVLVVFTMASGDELPICYVPVYEADLILSTVAHAMSQDACFMIMDTQKEVIND